MRIGAGILAVWNDCEPGEEAGYEAWYLGEHLPERLAIPGFEWGRRYRRLAGGSQDLPEYMTYYQTVTPDVLTSKAYLDRVNDPTPQTHRIMTQVFRNMNRTICRRIAGAGGIRTGFTVALVADGEALPELEAIQGITPDTIWREAWRSAEPDAQGISREEALRGGDAKISACLLIDSPTERDTLLVAQKLKSHGIGRVSAYQLTGSLHAVDLSTDT